MTLVRLREVVVLLVLVLICHIHETMRLVHHVLLASAGVSEHLVTEETQVAELDAFGDVGKEALETDDTVHVEHVEGMLLAHVIQAAFHSRELLVTEETDSKGV